MRTLYVAHDGAVLRREGERLRAIAKGELLSETPVRGLRQLVLVGSITLTPPALDLLVRSGVDTVFLSHRGRYRGRLVGVGSTHVHLRLAQYALATDPPRALAAARAIVAGKIANQRALVLRHARRHGTSDRMHAARSALAILRERVARAETIDVARGVEGAAAAAYFRAFGDLIRVPEMSFPGRNRRPPMDPVNALLSFGYTLLSNVVEAALQIVGLDPFLGTLHAAATARPSLVCDLVEELRAPVVDALVLAAINRRAIRLEDFEDLGPDEPVVLKRETIRWFVTLFERHLDRGAHYEPFGKRLAWRDVAEQQARRYARFVLGDAPEYEPLTTR